MIPSLRLQITILTCHVQVDVEQCWTPARDGGFGGPPLTVAITNLREKVPQREDLYYTTSGEF
jgi:hypothetical protein